MKTSLISAPALSALEDALSQIYWFKDDLRRFLDHSAVDSSLIVGLDWSDKKRNIVARLVRQLSSRQDQHRDALLNLMADVIRVTDFSHFDRLEDGKAKAAKAKAAVESLKKLYAGHDQLIKEKENADERKAASQAALKKNVGIKAKLDGLQKEVVAMVSMTDAKKRGYKLETVLNDLFSLFELNPKAPFKIEGEQIDGAFTLENTEYLLEAKWYATLIERKDLDAFNMKIERKLENTLGLFFAFNGFAPTGVQLHSGNRPKMILMDGQDLMAVLDGRIGLEQMLSRKRRHAATTGEIFFQFHRM